MTILNASKNCFHCCSATYIELTRAVLLLLVFGLDEGDTPPPTILGIVTLWIFFMWTLRWSVRLKTWPHVLHGCGTNRPWCWCRTWRKSVHLRLKTRAQMAHWNLAPSAVWHMVYTESVFVIRLRREVGEPRLPPPGGDGVFGVPTRSGGGGEAPTSPPPPPKPRRPPSETREEVTVVRNWKKNKMAKERFAAKWRGGAEVSYLYKRPRDKSPVQSSWRE